MNAYLYLRRSTEEHQADSLDTQRESATRFCTARGWTVSGELLDDGESRAEFKKRRGLLRLLAMCTPKGREFDAIVCRDESRIGAGPRLTVVLDDIVSSGVQLWYYTPEPIGHQVELDSPEAVVVNQLKSYAAEKERAKIAERVRENHANKARRGENVGGRCFGYNNTLTVVDGRDRKDFSINPEHASVLLEMAERFASGESERAIAKDFNVRRVPTPTAGGRGAGSWSPSCIREMLRRPRYRGSFEWGRLGAEYRGGTKVAVVRKRSEVEAVQRPELRIFPEELCERIDARIAEQEQRSGGRDGYKGAGPKYLLSGKALSRCTCGGSMQVGMQKIRRGGPSEAVYQCSFHKDRGDAVCDNALRRPVASVDAALVAWVRDNVLSEEVIAAALKELRKRLASRGKTAATMTAQLAEDVARLDREIGRLTKVAGRLDADELPEELAEQIARKTKERRQLRARLEVERTAPDILDLEVRRLEVEARKRLSSLADTLARNVAEGRRVLDSVLAEPVRFTPVDTPDGRRYRLEAATTAGDLFRIEGEPGGI